MSDVKLRRIALIPARSGSKGVPDKNIRHIGGHSLLVRAIEVAKETGLFDRIFVSTDSAAYAAEAARAGIEIPWLRPAELAADTALVADTIRHTLETFSARGESFDTLALLEPTSPLRCAADVAEVVAKAEAEGWDAAFTVSPVPIHYHALKQYLIDGDGTARFIAGQARPNVNRQSLTRTYIRNGICYGVRTSAFLATGSINGSRAWAVDIGRPAVSIDTEADFAMAEALLAAKSDDREPGNGPLDR